MASSRSEPSKTEEERIREVYSTRNCGALYSWFSPGHHFMIQSRERQLLRALSRQGYTSLNSRKVLEVGCGNGHWLREFIKWGVQPWDAHGIDLIRERIEEARRLCPAGVTLTTGNADVLDYPDATFDVVLQSTVFTSVLDGVMKKQIASEMIRVLRTDGLIVWYDFRVNNPGNPDVRGVGSEEIQELFPRCRIELRPTTLVPPLVRFLAQYSWLACQALEKAPWLCTHYIGIIKRK